MIVKTKKEIQKTQGFLEPTQKTYFFCQILTAYRRKMKHRGVQNITENHSHWQFVKKIIPLVDEFQSETEKSYQDACKLFIEWGIYLMGKTYSLTKFSNLGPKILEVYLADKEIDEDTYPDITSEVIRTYLRKVYERTGIQEEGSLENPLKYVEFVRMVSYCKGKGFNAIDYLLGQFDGLDWTGGIPDPAQLNSKSSIDRFIKFAYKNNIKVTRKENVKPQVAWDKILENGKH